MIHPSCQRVLDRHEASRQFDYPHKRRALDSWLSINNVLPADWNFWGYVTNPIAFQAVQDTTEGFMRSIFPRENFFDVEAEGGESDEQVELVREHVLLDLQWMRYKLIKYLQAMEAVSFGNGVVRHNATPVPMLFGGHGLRAIEYPVSRFNCYPAEVGSEIGTMPYFQEKMPAVPIEVALRMCKANDQQTLQEVQEQLKDVAIKGVQRPFGTIQGDDSEFDLYQRLSSAGYQVQLRGAGFPTYPTSNNLPKVVELLVHQEQDGFGNWNRLMIVANRQVLVCDVLSPFGGRPLWSGIKYSWINNELWQGRGLPDILSGQIDFSNILLNSINDMLLLMREPETFVEEGAMPKDRFHELKPYPNQVVPVTQLSGIKRMDRDKVGMPREFWTMMEQVQATVSRLTGQTDVGKGMLGEGSGLSKGADTASGMAMLMNAQTATMAFKLLLMENTGLLDALEITAYISRNCVQEPRMLNAHGNSKLMRLGLGEQIPYGPSEMQGNFRMKAVGSSRSMDDPQRAVKLMQWITMGLKSPNIAPRVDEFEAWMDGGRYMDVPHPEKYVKPEQQMAMDQIRAAAMGGAGGMPPGAMPPGGMPVPMQLPIPSGPGAAAIARGAPRRLQVQQPGMNG